jgi:hypothetical protein
MRAGVKNIGAQLQLRSPADRGTTIGVHVPMNAWRPERIENHRTLEQTPR